MNDTLYVEEIATPPGRLEHLPVTFFAVVMGLAGTSLAWRKADELLSAPAIVGEVLAWLSAALYVVVLAAYAAKLVLHRAAAIEELRHPVRLTFVPTITIALMLVATSLGAMTPGLAEVLWWIGAIGQLPLTVWVLHSWISRGTGLGPVTPAWFIPVVGNLAAPLAGVDFGNAELSWFYFGFGVIFWLALLPIVLSRLFVHEAPVPPKLLPTLAVLVAPPAVAFLGYRKLVPGEIDTFGRLLFWASIAFLVLVLSQVASLRKLPFFLSWWAYSFPTAAVTVATLAYGQAIGSPVVLTVASWVLLAALSSLILVLVAATGRGVVRQDICVPE